MSNEFSRILAIDYGEVRIGLAVSDPLKIIAQGLKTIANTNDCIETILSIISEYDIEEIIVGNPLLLSGKGSVTSENVNTFILRLSERTDRAIILVDERFTSVMAQRAILDMGIKKKKRRNKAKVDEIASAILLQGYLDSRKK